MEAVFGKQRAIVREFCQSNGAPTANWLRRLSPGGQRECIRQWILRTRGPEIVQLMPGVASRIFDAYAEDPYFYDALSAEDLAHRIDETKRLVWKRLEEEIRYGGLEPSDYFDVPTNPDDEPARRLAYLAAVRAYSAHKAICDDEWQRLVEGKQKNKDLSYVLLGTALVVAGALLFANVYDALWCAVIGAIWAVKLSWPK